MKKLNIYTLLVLVCVHSGNNSFGQKLYSGVAFNYGFSAMSFHGNSSSYDYQTDKATFTSSPFSLGKGFNSGLYGGYFLKDNIGLEMAVMFNYGFKSDIYSENATDLEYIYNDVYSLKGNTLRFIPAVRIKFGEKKLSSYLKTGIIISPVNSMLITENFEESDPGGRDYAIYEIKYSGGLSLGFHSGIGLTYSFGKLSMFAEASGYFQSWAPKHAEVIKNEVNGIDALLTMTTREKEVDFVNEYTDQGTSTNENQPAKELKIYLPMSSYGISLGVQFHFGK